MYMSVTAKASKIDVGAEKIEVGKEFALKKQLHCHERFLLLLGLENPHFHITGLGPPLFSACQLEKVP